MRIVKRNVLLLISIVFFVVYVLKFRSGFEDSSKTSEKQINYISHFFSFYGMCKKSPKLQVSIYNNISQNSLQQIQESLIQSHFPFCEECKYYSPNDSLILNKNVAPIKAFKVTLNLLHLPIMIHAPCIHSLALGNGLTRYFDLVSCAELTGELSYIYIAIMTLGNK